MNAPRATLALIGGASLFAPFVSHAANRLSSGQGVQAADWPFLALIDAALLASAVSAPRKAVELGALILAAFGLLFAMHEAGAMATHLALRSPPAARTMLGAGFWGLVFAFSLMIVDSMQRLRAGPLAILFLAFLLPLFLTLMALAGQFGHLSLAQEAAAHREAFAAAFWRHLLLVAATLALALAAGVPLGIAVQRRSGWRKPVFTVLNIVQTVPSVALFGLLIAPLSALGLSGIGVVPALIALVLYALLPVVRNVVAGLDGVDPATREAAQAMGLSPPQRLVWVELPLAAPALIAGLRIVTVQTIGLAVVAALIGAGGFGDFVFQGLGQYALDLVLLGALPAIGLALAADLLLRLAVERFA